MLAKLLSLGVEEILLRSKTSIYMELAFKLLASIVNLRW